MPFLAIHLFLLQLAAGVAVAVFLTRLRALGHGFHQIHVAVAFVAIVASLLLPGSGAEGALAAASGGGGATAVGGDGGWFGGAAAALLQREFVLSAAAALLLLVAAFLYSFFRTAAQAVHALAAIVLVALLAANLAAVGLAAPWGEGAAAPLLFLASSMLGALLLGLGVVTMNVGHWYLVNPRLGIGHLGLPTLVLFYLMIARGFVLLIAAALTYRHLDPTGRTTAGLILDHAFFEGARLVAGWLVPAVLAWMAVKTVEIRSTQSATGILYALLVLLAIGEALGAYLTVVRLLPW